MLSSKEYISLRKDFHPLFSNEWTLGDFNKLLNTYKNMKAIVSDLNKKYKEKASAIIRNYEDIKNSISDIDKHNFLEVIDKVEDYLDKKIKAENYEDLEEEIQDKANDNLTNLVDDFHLSNLGFSWAEECVIQYYNYTLYNLNPGSLNVEEDGDKDFIIYKGDDDEDLELPEAFKKNIRILENTISALNTIDLESDNHKFKLIEDENNKNIHHVKFLRENKKYLLSIENFENNLEKGKFNLLEIKISKNNTSTEEKNNEIKSSKFSIELER
ncbi:hypothetical protein ACW95P_04855 [Candidatus Mycoplasma pogonae]